MTYTLRRRAGGYTLHLEHAGRTVRTYLVRTAMEAWALASAWAN